MKLAVWLSLIVMAVGVCATAQAPHAPSVSPAPQQSPSTQTPGAQGPGPSIIIRTESVIVPVTIKDKAGQLVGDLQKNDFRVFADGIEQRITGFSSNPVPLSAVVVVDDDLEQKEAATLQNSLTVVSAAFGAPDEVAVITYDEFPRTVFDFSFNNDTLFTQLKRIELSSHPGGVVSDPTNDPTNVGPIVNGQQLPNGRGLPVHGAGRYKKDSAINDALFSAATMLKNRGRDRRKIVFLISDLVNSANSHTFEETLHELTIDDVSVYSIAVVHSLPVGKALVQGGAGQVNRYAKDTGGDTFYGSKEADLEHLYSEVTEQARNEYTLTFSPQGVDRSKDYHQLEVRVERPNLNILTRPGYYQSAISAGH